MKKRQRKSVKPLIVIGGVFLLIVALGISIVYLLQGKDIPVFSPSGTIASQEKNLLIFTLLLSLVVIVPVYTMLGVFAFRYRDKGGKGKYTPDEEDNRWFEALWWGIPIAIIAILGTVTWISTHQLDPNKALTSDVKPLTVQVVAIQWRWLFLYPDYNIASINELRIPVNTPVSFRLTADGPMAGFWIPALGSQVYAMPTMSSRLSLQADKAGVFRGSNSNITGTGYADMDFRAVSLLSKDVFDSWVTSITSNNQYKHLDWSTYEDLARQTRDKSIYYFHLHDRNLYSKIIEKFSTAHAVNSRQVNQHEGHR